MKKDWEEKHNKENPIRDKDDINRILDEMEAKRKNRKEFAERFTVYKTHEFDHIRGGDKMS